jgi:hypothetical protein
MQKQCGIVITVITVVGLVIVAITVRGLLYRPTLVRTVQGALHVPYPLAARKPAHVHGHSHMWIAARFLFRGQGHIRAIV